MNAAGRLARLLPRLLLLVGAACAAPRFQAPPASLHPLAEREDLWILVPGPGEPASEPLPPSGLFARRADGSAAALVPRTSSVRCDVEGRLAAVTLAQLFGPEDLAGARELELRLALPPGAALDELVVSFGARRIRAVVHERERARELWALARARGRRAILVGEAEPGVFVQSIALGAEEGPLELRAGWAQPVRLMPFVAPDGPLLRVPLGAAAAGRPLALAVAVDAGVPLAALEAPELEGFTATLDEEGRASAAWNGPAPAELALTWHVTPSRFDRAVVWSDADTLHLVVYPARVESLGSDDSVWSPRVEWERYGAREVGASKRLLPRAAFASLARRMRTGTTSTLHVEVDGGSVLGLEPRPSTLRAAGRVRARAEIEELVRRAQALDPADPATRAELEALGDEALALALEHGLVSPLTELLLIDAAAR